MNRKILIQVTTPAVLIGLLLFGTCLAGAWYVSRLQKNLARVLSENVDSQKAAQELEIGLRQLQFHSFLYLVDPTRSRHQKIDDDHKALEAALGRTRDSARTPEQKHWVEEIETSYEQYNQDIDDLVAQATKVEALPDLVKLAEAHPLKEVVQPAHELLTLNKDMMDQTSEESQRVAQQGQT